jgi:hypothetical protein
MMNRTELWLLQEVTAGARAKLGLTKRFAMPGRLRNLGSEETKGTCAVLIGELRSRVEGP